MRYNKDVAKSRRQAQAFTLIEEFNIRTMNDNTNNKTASDKVIENIAQMIVSGEVKPGEKLLTERAFAEKYKVTRSCVREAIRALALIGMVTIHPGGGTYVADNNGNIPEETVVWMYHQNVHKYDEIYTARTLIETEVYLECFDQMNEEIRTYVRDAREILLNIDTDNITGEEMEKILSSIDSTIGKYCGNSVMYKLLLTILALRKEDSMNILTLISSRESAVFYRSKILTAMLQDDKKILKEALKKFFLNSSKELHLK